MVFCHKTIINNLESEKKEKRKPPNSNCRQSLVWGLLGVDVVMSARPRVRVHSDESVSQSFDTSKIVEENSSEEETSLTSAVPAWGSSIFEVERKF